MPIARGGMALISSAALLVLAGCGVVGGPPEDVLVQVAREGVSGGQLGPEWQSVAAEASFSKTGMCNTQAEPGTHVCMVEIETANPPPGMTETKQTVVVKVKEQADGSWVSAE